MRLNIILQRNTNTVQRDINIMLFYNLRAVVFWNGESKHEHINSALRRNATSRLTRPAL